MLLSFAQTLGTIWGKAWPILVAVLFFGIIIMVHEAGHFAFAKLFKVKVHKFALGMGPRLIKFGKKETEYSLRLFPIGGYVMMEGEDEESDDPRSFSHKPVWQRIVITAAGGVTNLILGVLVTLIMLGVSSQLLGTRQINYFHENAVSEQNGLQAKDELLRIDGKRVFSDTDISFLMMRNADGVFDMTVRRDGEIVELTDVKFETKDVDGKNTIIYDFVIVGIEDPGIGTLLRESVMQSMSMGRMVYLSLFDMITGQYGLSDLSGPIGVVDVIAQSTEQRTEGGSFDPTLMLNLMALISINIGLFNLLPVPALDGGRIFFMLVELITRKKIPAKYEAWVHAIGMILLLLLVAVVSFSDIMKLIRR